MSIADELQLLINTKEQMREALGLDIDEPFSQYPVIAESKKVEVVQTTGQSTTKVMSQKAVADLVVDTDSMIRRYILSTPFTPYHLFIDKEKGFWSDPSD